MKNFLFEFDLSVEFNQKKFHRFWSGDCRDISLKNLKNFNTTLIILYYLLTLNKDILTITYLIIIKNFLFEFYISVEFNKKIFYGFWSGNCRNIFAQRFKKFYIAFTLINLNYLLILNEDISTTTWPIAIKNFYLNSTCL